MEPVHPTDPSDGSVDAPGESSDASEAAGRPDRRQFIGIVAAGGVVAVSAAGGALYLHDRDDGEGASTVPGSADTTAAPSLQVRSDDPPPLPIPAGLPDPNADTPVVVIATLAVPRLGLGADVQEGITLAAINRGPAHWPGTALPGQLGNVVIAGHRTIHTKPFAHLDQLQVGDPVVMTTPTGSFTYTVRGTVIVPSEAIDIAAQSYAHTATLFACHPPGSTRQRIVAKLALLGPDGQPVDAADALPPLDSGSQETQHTLYVRAPDPLTDSGG